MSELQQQGCKWTIKGREKPTIKGIRQILIEKKFIAAQLTPNIFINTMLHGEKKHDKTMSKAAGIIFKLVSDQHQPIIERKTLKEAWIALQNRFQYINLMSTSQIIYDATTKKLLDFKNMHKYTSHYQAFFDKVINLLIETFSYTCKSTEIYFQATILMNIGVEYSALVSSIWKN